MNQADFSFKEYRENGAFISRQPDLSNLQDTGELQLITPEEGRQEMSHPPASGIVYGNPATSRKNKGIRKYLWVIAPAAFPIAVEDNGNIRTGPQRGYLSHTNLTGGGGAHAGGEMWFCLNNELYINGCSSRYRPRNSAELRLIACGFAKLGYRVANMGWDADTNIPARIVKGGTEWFGPTS